MEGLPQSETQNPVEKKVNRRWRKNTEIKISRAAAEAVDRSSNDKHEKLWQQVLGAEPVANKPTGEAQPLVNQQEAIEPRRRNATEAHNIHGGLQPERIGQVLITAAEAASYQPPSAERARVQAIDEHVETVSREDLLELSSKIVIDGSSLKQAYETHLIGEKALRRLVAEHLSGGNVKEALRKELVQHEIDFERDPMMRDRSHQAAQNGGGSLDAMMQRAEASIDTGTGDSMQDTQYPTKKKRAVRAYQPKLYHGNTMDVVMVSIILILLILVIVLALTRK